MSLNLKFKPHNTYTANQTTPGFHSSFYSTLWDTVQHDSCYSNTGGVTVNPCLHASPTPRTSFPIWQHVIRQPYPKMGPTIVMGMPKVRVWRQNPPVRSVPPRSNRARDNVTKRVGSNSHYLGPDLGDQTSSSIISESREQGFHHHHPHQCGAPRRPVSLDRDYLGTMRETTRPNLHRGKGASAPIGSYGEVLAHADSH
jgi:hypothetical protein